MMICPKCGEAIPGVVINNVVEAQDGPWLQPQQTMQQKQLDDYMEYREATSLDFYTCIKQKVDKYGKWTILCTWPYPFTDGENGRKKLHEEGYRSRSSGCDTEWYKE